MMLGLGANLMLKNGGGAAASFNPTTVSGMAAWWAARLESFANNDPVGTATDWTGNGLSLTQATASKKPVFLTGQKNGLPAFSADGVDDFFSGGDILDIGTGSIHFFFVAKYDSVASDAAMMAKAKAGGHPSRYSGVDVVSSQWYSLLEPTSGGALNLNTGTANTSWHLFEFVVDRPLTKVAMWLDGVEIASSSAVPAGDINSTFRFLLFAYNDGTDTGETAFMPGKIAEVWCWQRVLTAGERDTLRIGAANLYDIPVYTSQFQPNQIAGLKLWLDASQITGLNDGDAVATWTDASGNGYNATQATASKQPTYQTNEVNGKPAVQTDGVDDFIRSTFATAQPFTRFSVLSVSLTGGNHVLGGVVLNTALWCPVANSLQMYAGTFGPNVSVSSSTWVLVVECYDGASSFIEVGGARTTGNPGTWQPGGVTIGADLTGVSNSSGKYAEVLHYNGRLSNGDISTLVTYLNTKYGL